MKVNRVKDYQIVREKNRRVVLHALRKHERMTREELMKSTHLSTTTLLSILRGLEEEDYVVKAGYNKSSGGRPSQVFKFNFTGRHIVGCTLGIPKLKIAVLDLDMNIVNRQGSIIKGSAEVEEVLGKIEQLIHVVVKQSNIRFNKILGIGFTVSGVIDKGSGKSVSIERLDNWKEVPVVQYLEKKFQLPVFFANDVDAALLAEKNLNKRDFPKNLAYIHVEDGIGMSVLINGKIYQGNKGNAGLIGHTTVEPNGILCRCGNRGCLENFVLEPALIEKTKSLIAGGAESIVIEYVGGDLSKLQIAHLSRAFSEKDPLITKVVREAIEYLVIGISNIIKLFELYSIVLNAPSVFTNPSSMKLIHRRCEERLQKMSTGEVDIIPAKGRETDTLIGAGMLVLEGSFQPLDTDAITNPVSPLAKKLLIKNI